MPSPPFGGPEQVLRYLTRYTHRVAISNGRLVPSGGLAPDHAQWLRPRYRFFLPVDVLSPVFRGKFVAGLKRAWRARQLCWQGSLPALTQEKLFRSFVRSLYRQPWVVYAKPPFGGPQHVLHYLARYTHRVAI